MPSPVSLLTGACLPNVSCWGSPLFPGPPPFFPDQHFIASNKLRFMPCTRVASTLSLFSVRLAPVHLIFLCCSSESPIQCLEDAAHPRHGPFHSCHNRLLTIADLCLSAFRGGFSLLSLLVPSPPSRCQHISPASCKCPIPICPCFTWVAKLVRISLPSVVQYP